MNEKTRRLWIIAAVLAFALGGAVGCRRGQPPEKAAPPATNAPGNAPASSGQAGSAPAANTPAGSAGIESPFPGKAKADGAPAKTAATVRVAAVPASDRIPGVPTVALPPPKKSPFRERGLDGPSTSGAKTGGNAAPRVGMGPPPRPINVWPGLNDLPGGLPPADIRPVGPGLPGSSTPGAPPVSVPPAPSLAVQLTGVIRGEPPMAILEGEQAHYIVQEGDPLPGGYIVATISQQKVILRGGGGNTLVLRLGGKSS